MIKEYKWVEVVCSTKETTRNGKYNRFSQIIVLYPHFFTLDKIKQTSILEHEYWHHIWHKMPMLYKKIWEWLSNWKLIKTLNIMWLTKATTNSYVSSYAKTNIKEDWSECIEVDYLVKHHPEYKGTRFKAFATYKMWIAVSMYNYFAKKEQWK